MEQSKTRNKVMKKGMVWEESNEKVKVINNAPLSLVQRNAIPFLKATPN